MEKYSEYWKRGGKREGNKGERERGKRKGKKEEEKRNREKRRGKGEGKKGEWKVKKKGKKTKRDCRGIVQTATFSAQRADGEVLSSVSSTSNCISFNETILRALQRADREILFQNFIILTPKPALGSWA